MFSMPVHCTADLYGLFLFPYFRLTFLSYRVILIIYVHTEGMGMLRATVAARRLQLDGCDTMHNAAKLSLFPVFDEQPHCTISVNIVPSVTMPVGEHIAQNGNADILQLRDGRKALHRDEWYTVVFDDDFSDVSITLGKDTPQREELHYLLTSQCFSYHLLSVGGCSLHSAGLRLGDKGVALCGRSGVGKSTLTRHLQSLCDDITVLSEDMPALTAQNGWYIHGTPFCGQDEGCADGRAPLGAVVILEQAQVNRLITPPPTKALHALLSCIPLPKYHEALHRVGVDRAIRLVSEVPIVVFENNGTSEAVALLLAALGKTI